MVDSLAVSAPAGVYGPAIVRAAAGMALLPGNASRLVRLNRLAALGMALPDGATKPLSSSAVKALLKRDDIGGPWVRAQEDPYSEILVQSISFYGGAYLVSPGCGEHTVADVENLLDAAYRDDWMPSELTSIARELARGMLIVSDLVLTRAGLSRGTRPGRDPGTPVEVPSAARLDELGRSAFLTDEELEGHGSWLRTVVDTFALDPGQLTRPCSTEVVVEDRLIETPFLRVEGGYQVATPLDLLLSLRYHLLRLMYQAGQLEELGERYRSAVLRRVERQLPPGTKRRSVAREGGPESHLFTLDSATDLHVILATDPLTDWSAEEIWGHCDTRSTVRRIAELIQPDFRSTYSTAESLLHIVVLDSPGRSAFWGLPDVPGADPVLMIRADDLEVILHREGDPFGLLYFAQAIERRQSTAFVSNILDDYSMYQVSHRSFYFSDDHVPTLALVQVGDGYFERESFYEELDRHGVVASAEGRPVIQVSRRYPRDTPEIFLTEFSRSFFGYVVEVDANSIFVSPDRDHKQSCRTMPVLLEAVSFWIRECIVVGGLVPKLPQIRVLVSSGPESMWRVGTAPAATRSVMSDASAKTLQLTVTDLFVSELALDANVAERHLVEVLLTDLFAVGPADCARLVDRVAPLGPKRMISVFDANNGPVMQAEHLPTPTRVHEQVTAQILDELGEWLRDPKGLNLPVGVVEKYARTTVLNQAVRHLVERMETSADECEKRALLDYLISQNEALIHSELYSERVLPSRLACFGADAGATNDLVRRRAESASSSRANRFLIEYVAAKPPAGAHIPTTLGYGLMLGLAEEIIERGTESDFLHFGLADFEVSVLGSGRLGMNRDEPVEAAMQAYAAASGERSIRNALDLSPHEGPASDFPEVVAASADAMRSEFGFTLGDLQEVCGGLLELGTPDRVTRVAPEEARTSIAAGRQLEPSLVKTVLDVLTLSPRHSFMEVGADDVPWRFNRDMSYVRRPLVLQGNELVFGYRSIYGAVSYWLASIVSGRLQGNAKTSAMRQFITQTRGRITRQFEAAVAERLRELGLAAKSSVKKVAGARIVGPDSKDLGDIDVLAWHEASSTLLVVEAKDFEVARTPAEMSNEINKLFGGRPEERVERSTAAKHSRRLDWVRTNLPGVLALMGADAAPTQCSVRGVIVTSEPLVTPLASECSIPVVAFADMDLATLGLATPRYTKRGRRRREKPPKT